MINDRLSAHTLTISEFSARVPTIKCLCGLTIDVDVCGRNPWVEMSFSCSVDTTSPRGTLRLLVRDTKRTLLHSSLLWLGLKEDHWLGSGPTDLDNPKSTFAPIILLLADIMPYVSVWHHRERREPAHALAHPLRLTHAHSLRQ
jgi:hypothetical protein